MNTTTPTPRAAALRDTSALALGLVPFGLALGVAAAATGFGSFATLLGGPVVYAGSAQLAAMTLLHQGTAIALAVLSAAAVNARFLLYGAALATRFADQPAWMRWIGPQLVVDQTFLAAGARPALAGREFRSYWLWLGGGVGVVWTASLAAGLLVGPALPELPHLRFVGAALFLGLLVPRLSSRPAALAAGSGAAVAAVASLAVGSGVAMLLGAAFGMAAGRTATRPAPEAPGSEHAERAQSAGRAGLPAVASR